MSQRLSRIREIPSDMAPEEPDLEAMGYPGSEYVLQERQKRLQKRILSEYRRIRQEAGEPVLEDQVVQATSPLLKDIAERARGRLRELGTEAREERIRERMRKIIEKTRDQAARRAMQQYNRRRQREKKRQQLAERAFLPVDDAGQLRAPSPEPLMLHSPDLLVREYQPKDFGLQAQTGDLMELSPNLEKERLEEERARLRRERRAKRRELQEMRRRREEVEERRRLHRNIEGVYSKIEDLKKMCNGSLLLETRTALQADQLLKCDHFGEIPVKVEEQQILESDSQNHLSP
ncbi:trichohyalin [Anabrus simplex]|uniref:trichohyalin n=1 Tax=Anabrus simplex TaxID=316456 RepID=UPI0035A28DE8